MPSFAEWKAQKDTQKTYQQSSGSSFAQWKQDKETKSLMQPTDFSNWKKQKDLRETISPSDQSTAEVFGEHAVAGIPAAAASIAGAEVGAAWGTAAGPVGTVVGGVVGAIAGGIGGGLATRALTPDSINQHLDEGEKQHPIAAFTGDIASFGSVAKVGAVKAVGKLTAGQHTAVLAAAGGGLEAGREAVQDEKMDSVKIAISALTTPIFGGDKTKLGKLVTGDFKLPVNTEDPSKLVEEVTKRNQWEIPKEYEGVTVKEGKTGREQDDMRPVPAQYDRENKTITLDKEEITKRFEEKPWVKFGRPEDTFRTPEEYQQFVLAHEYEHHLESFDDFKKAHEANLPPETEVKLSDKELYQQYHQQVNSRAWEKLEANGFQEGRVDLGVSKEWKTPENYRDNLHQLKNSATNDKITLNALIEKGKADGITPEMEEQFRLYEEGKGPKPEGELYDKYIKSVSEASDSLAKDLMEKGVIEKEDMEGAFAPRMLKPMSPEEIVAMKEAQGEKDLSMKEKVSKWIDEHLADQGGLQDIERTRSAGKQRALYALEGKDGNRRIVQFTKSGDLIEWKGGKTVGLGPAPGKYKSGDSVAGGTLRQAAIEEIEKQSPYKYSRDYQSIRYKKYQELREMARAHEAIENMKNSPDFSKIAHKLDSGKELPEGMAIPKYLDKVPSLAGYAFDTRVAEIIEDFARVRDPNMLTRISGLLVQNMMLNPIPHMFNEAMHLYNARGLTGWVTPAGISRFMKTTPEAIRGVLTQNQEYRDIIKAGGNMLAPSTRENALEASLYKKGVDEFAKTSDFKELAKSFAVKPVELYKALSKASSKAMWITRDIMYMQYVKELQTHKGIPLEKAVEEAGRHMPQYQMPTRIGEKVLGGELSRSLSTVLQNPNVSVFSRYHFGMVKSMIETAKDVGAIRKGKAGLAEFKEGVDTVAAITVALSILYPLMDMAAQSITGNDKAEQRRAGPYHLMDSIAGVAEGTKGPQAVLASVFTFNPALLGLAQLGVDMKMYNGQPIYHPTDSAEQIASDVGSYLAMQVPSVSTSMRTSDEFGGGLPQFAAQQIDIKSPSEKAVARIEKITHRDQRASEIREQKRKLREALGR